MKATSAHIDQVLRPAADLPWGWQRDRSLRFLKAQQTAL